ncbi:MAG TPA: ABC transporter ATP-binding protein [Bryobacteraceae bacterium]|nr:ABC transporter ATP-binding protein [Bryobacteraceae bacterium]
MTSLLEVDLTAGFPNRPQVLDRVRFSIAEGEAFGLVGESGAGKSTIALALLGMLAWNGARAVGAIRWRGQNLLEWKERDLRRLRGKEIALVPQSPAGALNPALTLAAHFEEAWRAHADEPWRKGRGRVPELLEAVQLPGDEAFLKKRPRELSVGMAQRFVIALALLHRPALLVADEPTSALDPITQAEILKLFAAIHERGAALLYISHDLPSVAELCGRIAILCEGRVVESGDCRELFFQPQHQYTQRLIDAIAVWPPRD